MPQPNGRTWRHCRAKMDITSNQAAELLGITGGALRQIETAVKPVSLALAYRAERLYQVPVSELIFEDEDETRPHRRSTKKATSEATSAQPGTVAGAA